jgi:hypothetical protein
MAGPNDNTRTAPTAALANKLRRLIISNLPLDSSKVTSADCDEGRDHDVPTTIVNNLRLQLCAIFVKFVHKVSARLPTTSSKGSSTRDMNLSKVNAMG